MISYLKPTPGKNIGTVCFITWEKQRTKRMVMKFAVFWGYYAASCGNCLQTFRDNVSVPSSRVKSPSRKERKPATYNVDSIWEGARGVAISRRDDSQ